MNLDYNNEYAYTISLEDLESVTMNQDHNKIVTEEITSGIMYDGYRNDLLEPLKFWRVRFLLIPMENVPDTMNTTNETLDDEVRKLCSETSAKGLVYEHI
ncbi:hypothetical protein Glove_266g21 [Diversispora epigaea]|uniref:Uncharacterized protein n=1 Tax=Diversispora epigaea TaxID=1348612 RepID=A0A397IAK0_9GLOM|nr:hypothetical protein Glove_266g21 [Diversispora epigaea]